MSSNPSNKDRMLLAIARPIAHPNRYRRQFRLAGASVVLAAAVYFLFGTLAFVGLIVIGGIATRLVLKFTRAAGKALPR